jgi:hypothetical protein
MGLILLFLLPPSPLNVADNSLSAFMNVNMLNGHLLLA